MIAASKLNKEGKIMTDYLTRAFAAYFRSGDKDQPSNSSRVVEDMGRGYVVLENLNGVLAVYRIRNDGILRRMKRWPKEIEVLQAV